MSLKIYHNQSVYTGGLNSPVLTADVVLASEAEALEKRNAELESALCETCKDPVCEDSQLGYWILKAQGYEKALREIREHRCGNCGAQNMADDALEEK